MAPWLYVLDLECGHENEVELPYLWPLIESRRRYCEICRGWKKVRRMDYTDLENSLPLSALDDSHENSQTST